MKLEVLFEDNHCLVVNKPAGLLSQADVTGDPSLVSWAQDYLKARYQKPGNVYVGLVHRLDRPTSGVVLLARTSKAASRLSAQFRSGQGHEGLLGHRRGRAGAAHGEWIDLLEKDRRPTSFAQLAEQPEKGRWRGWPIVLWTAERGWLQARIAAGDGAESSVAGPACQPGDADRGGPQVRGGDGSEGRGRAAGSRCTRGSCPSRIRRVRK